MELSVLKEKLLVMAGYAETAVNRAVKSLIRRDDDMARRTREEDDLIDALELEIDCIALRTWNGSVTRRRQSRGG